MGLGACASWDSRFALVGLAACGGSWGNRMGVVESYGGVFLWFAMAMLLVFAWRRSKTRARRPPQRIGSIGPGAAGAFYEMLSEDRRKAIEIILEEKTGYHEPEDADGNLPDLEHPGVPRRPQ